MVKVAARGGLPVSSGNTHQVQVGAFFSQGEAQAVLRRVQQRAGRLLRGSQPVSVKVAAHPRTIYRARFAGFDVKRASNVCAQLKTVQIDCFVMRAN